MAAVTFSPYGITHWVLLVLTVIGAVLLVRFGRRHRDTSVGETFTRIFAIVQLTVTLGFMIIWLVPPLSISVNHFHCTCRTFCGW
jgi:hypothetical protein